MRAVEQFLASRADLAEYANLIRINANVLAEERQGYGRAVLARLFANARKIFGPDTPFEVLRHSVERGMIFIDEVDKIRADVRGEPNVRGIVAQEALLTLMENENVEFEFNGMTFGVNSSTILFIVGGAFEELYEAVFRRATDRKSVV